MESLRTVQNTYKSNNLIVPWCYLVFSLVSPQDLGMLFSLESAETEPPRLNCMAHQSRGSTSSLGLHFLGF